jgi:hypothetical protein
MYGSDAFRAIIWEISRRGALRARGILKEAAKDPQGPLAYSSTLAPVRTDLISSAAQRHTGYLAAGRHGFHLWSPCRGHGFHRSGTRAGMPIRRIAAYAAHPLQLAWLISRIRRRISAGNLGRPLQERDFRYQYRRNTARCQRWTVSR